jgi:hypothetical protein
LKKYDFVGPLLESLHDSVLLLVHLYQRHKFQIFQNFPFRHSVRIQINHGASYNQYVLVVPTDVPRMMFATITQILHLTKGNHGNHEDDILTD